MKELVRGRDDEVFWLRVIRLVGNHYMGIVVLQSTGRVRLGRCEEVEIDVLVVWQIVEHSTVDVDDPRKHLSKPFAPFLRERSGRCGDDEVRFACGMKPSDVKVAGLCRRIDEGVVVGR